MKILKLSLGVGFLIPIIGILTSNVISSFLVRLMVGVILLLILAATIVCIDEES